MKRKITRSKLYKSKRLMKPKSKISRIRTRISVISLLTCSKKTVHYTRKSHSFARMKEETKSIWTRSIFSLPKLIVSPNK